MRLVELAELMASRGGSVNPQKFPAELFDLYSIPAFDRGESDMVRGADIGSAKQVVQPEDVLLSKIVPHIRRSWVVGVSRGSRMIASGEWIIFRHPDADPRYLRHVLVGDPFHAQFMATVSGVGGSLLRARPAFVGKIRIPLPSIEEQHRIADVLDRADALRAKRREALAHLDDLTQSIFLHMFGGTIPTTELGRVLTFVTSGGRGWAKYYAESGSLFIRSLDVQINAVELVDTAYVRPPNNAEARRTEVRGEDTLLTITGSLIGRAAPVPQSLAGAYISQHVAILRPDPRKLRSTYLSHFLNLPTGGQRQIAAMQYGQTKPGLNFEQIRSFQIPLPSLSSQDAYLERVQRIERIRLVTMKQLCQFNRLFESLQQRAFAGEL